MSQLYFQRVKPLLVDTTVTRGSIHLNVGDQGACLPHIQRSNAVFVSASKSMNSELVSTFSRGVYPLHKGQHAVFLTSWQGSQLVIAKERGPFHKDQYAVFISVCKDQAIYERFPLKEGRPKMHSSVLVTGTMTKSMLRGGVQYISKGLIVPCIQVQTNSDQGIIWYSDARTF